MKFIKIYILINVFAVNIFCQEQASISPEKDNTLYESETDLSNGAGSFLFTGTTGNNLKRRALLKFDISGNVPGGAVITAAELKMHMSRTTAGDETVSIHRVLSDWGEGTSNADANEGSGAIADSGEATWSYSFYTTNQWQNEGGDFDTTITAASIIGGTGDYTFGTSDKMISDLQNWLDNPAENFGWALIGNESSSKTAKRFDSRENSSENNRPVLTVTFTTTVSVAEGDYPAENYRLEQNYPNPFNPVTTIKYSVPTIMASVPIAKESNELGLVTLKVYNILGQEIATLVNERKSAGSYSVKFDASGFVSGIYIYRLSGNGLSESRKMVLLK